MIRLTGSLLSVGNIISAANIRMVSGYTDHPVEVTVTFSSFVDHNLAACSLRVMLDSESINLAPVWIRISRGLKSPI